MTILLSALVVALYSLTTTSWHELVPAFRRRVAKVNDVSRAPPLVPLTIDGVQAGEVSPVVLEALRGYPEVFQIAPDGTSVSLALRLETASFEERNAAVAKAAAGLRESGVIQKWRDEILALTTGFDAPPVLLTERRFVPLLGGRGYGVAINGWSVSPETGQEHLWVATRASDKATWPGMLDSMAAGALAAGQSPVEAAQAEAAEEAGVPAQLAASARAAGAVSYRGVDEDPVLPKNDTFFVFDLELPWDFQPRPVDGEVECFERMSVDAVAQCIAYGEALEWTGKPSGGGTPSAFKPNINLVVIDWLLRRGHVPPDAPGYLDLVTSLRHEHCR
jgi:8-oxo-dGTP pyrophosphatase MutT (NUDIX family)